jgi:hypothetical protein
MTCSKSRLAAEKDLDPANLTSHPAFSGSISSLVLGYVGMEQVQHNISVKLDFSKQVCKLPLS